MYYCYILQSQKSNKYYIGSTFNVTNRVSMHNGKRVKSTKPYIPWVLKYKESFHTLKEARRREVQIKSWHSRAAIERLISMALSSSGQDSRFSSCKRGFNSPWGCHSTHFVRSWSLTIKDQRSNTLSEVEGELIISLAQRISPVPSPRSSIGQSACLRNKRLQVRVLSRAPSKITSCQTSYVLLWQERNHLARPHKEVILRSPEISLLFRIGCNPFKQKDILRGAVPK